MVKTNHSLVEGLSIDWVHRSIYWTDAVSDSIEMSYLNGSSRKVIVSDDLDEPRAIVVDPGERYDQYFELGFVTMQGHKNISKRFLIFNSGLFTGQIGETILNLKDQSLMEQREKS